MTPPKTPSLVVCLSLCLLTTVPPLAAQEADTQPLPRYRFEVGQKIVFAGNSTAKASYGTTKSQVTWTIWVTDRTSTGGYQLVLKRSTNAQPSRAAPCATARRETPLRIPTAG